MSRAERRQVATREGERGTGCDVVRQRRCERQCRRSERVTGEADRTRVTELEAQHVVGCRRPLQLWLIGQGETIRRTHSQAGMYGCYGDAHVRTRLGLRIEHIVDV